MGYWNSIFWAGGRGLFDARDRTVLAFDLDGSQLLSAQQRGGENDFRDAYLVLPIATLWIPKFFIDFSIH